MAGRGRLWSCFVEEETSFEGIKISSLVWFCFLNIFHFFPLTSPFSSSSLFSYSSFCFSFFVFPPPSPFPASPPLPLSPCLLLLFLSFTTTLHCSSHTVSPASLRPLHLPQDQSVVNLRGQEKRLRQVFISNQNYS